MQHNLRDPSRDRLHGRVYRVVAEGRPLVKPAKIAGESIANLLALLKSPDDRVAYRAKIELSARKSDEVIDGLNLWLAELDQSHAEHEYHVLQALWVHQHHNVVNANLLERVLASPEPRARAAAVKVVVAWRDRLSNPLALINKAAADAAPQVRLEAIRAASFFTVPEAVEVVLIANEQPSDPYLEHMTRETMRTLQPIVDKANSAGQRIAFTTDTGARYALKNLSNEELLKEKRDRLVLLELLNRPGMQDGPRREAVRELSKLTGKTELSVVMDAILALDARQNAPESSQLFDLVRLLTSRNAAELAAARAELVKLATTARQPLFRQIGMVALLTIDGKADQVWELALRSTKSLEDFVSAIPLISDLGLRTSLYDKIEPLVHGLPPQLAGQANRGTVGRFVRVEIPGPATLTLAEVEVYSNGENVARSGRASQKNIAHGGLPGRGNDGNKSGKYSDAGQTHTEENTGNPYWEVDLGQEIPLERIVIYNRTDEDLGQRLNNFTLKVLDDRRQEVFRVEQQPAPKVSAEYSLNGSGPVVSIRRAAMQALPSMRGQEGRVFAALAKFVKEDLDRSAAIRALQRLPKTAWPPEAAAELSGVLLAAIQKLPAAERTSPAALDMLEFTDALAALLPPDQAKELRAKLGELGVRVIKLGTLFEKMAYDKEALVVAAGKPVEFVLENSDLMPHNFVIVQPGSLETVGMLAEEHAQAPGFAERQFVPESDQVLAQSKLMLPRETQRVSFVAPAKPGVYPYVCTYPGHWRRMYGALYVVPDLDAYQADPEAYLAAHKIEPRDALLKDRRPRTEWKLEELATAANSIPRDKGRNFQTGREMFKVASCVSCHKFGGAGQEFGPDLTKLDPKWQPADLVEHILNPAKKIDEKYQSWIFELKSGKTITGMVVAESNGVAKVIENPLAKADTVDVPAYIVETRTKLPTSLMPKGLLDQLARDEILDLIAYILAHGEPAHPAFQPAADGHDHHEH
jgi:putative heme-binding domain-containing protein